MTRTLPLFGACTLITFATIAAPVRVAVVAIGADARTELAAAKLSEAVAGVPGCETLDRTAVAAVLKERSLAASGSTQWSDQLRKMLAADVFAFLEPLELNGAPYIRLTVSETRSGAILGSASAPAGAAMPTLVEALKDSLRKRGDLAVSRSQYVAWLGAGSEESSGRLAGPAAALSALVGLDLVANPRLAMLDRAHLDHLGEETIVGAADLELKRSVVVVEASLRPVGATREADAVIALRTGGGTVLTSAVVRVDLNDMRAAGHRVAGGIATALFVSAAAQATVESPAAQEAAMLAGRAGQLAGWGEWPRAIELAEAAYALDHNKTNRVQLASFLFSRGAAESDPKRLTRCADLMIEHYENLAVDLQSIRTELNPIVVGWRYRARDPQAADLMNDRATWQELRVKEEQLFQIQLVIGERVLADYPDFYWRTWCVRLFCAASCSPGDPSAHLALLRKAVDECARQASTGANMPADAVLSVVETVCPETLEVICASPKGLALYQEFVRYLRGHSDPLLAMAGCVGQLHLDTRGQAVLAGSGFSERFEPLGVELAKNMARMPVTSPYRTASKKTGLDTNREKALFALFMGGGRVKVWSGSWRGDWWHGDPLCPLPFQPGARTGVSPDRLSRLLSAQKVVIEESFGTNQEIAVATSRAVAFGADFKGTLDDWVKQGWGADAWAMAQRLVILGRRAGVLGIDAGFAQQFAPPPPDAGAVTAPPGINKTAAPFVFAGTFTNGDAGWNDYAIKQIGPGVRRRSLLREYPALDCEQHRMLHLLPDGNYLDVLDAVPLGDPYHQQLGVRVVRVSLTDGQIVSDHTISVMPTGFQFHQNLMCVARDDTQYYLGTDQGIFTIDRRTNKQGLIDAAKGLPGNNVRAMSVMNGRLYLSLGPQSALAAYDPKTRQFDILASERTVQRNTVWDGKPFQVTGIQADPQKTCLWLRERCGGIWRYDVQPRSLSKELARTGACEWMLLGSSFLEDDSAKDVAVWLPDAGKSVPLPIKNYNNQVGRWLGADIRMSPIEKDLIVSVNRPLTGKTIDNCMIESSCLVLLRNGKCCLFQDFGTERDPPLGQVHAVAPTDAGVVLVNRQGVVFLVKRRTPADAPGFTIWGTSAMSHTNAPASTELEQLLVDTIVQMSGGKTITAEQRERCFQGFGAYCKELKKKDPSDMFDNLPEKDNVAHYMNSWRMAVINPEGYGGWVFHHGGRDRALEPIRHRLATTEDPFLLAAVIVPASQNGETEYAVWAYHRLARKDPFVARQALALIMANRSGGSVQFVSLLKEVDAEAAKPPGPNVYRRQ